MLQQMKQFPSAAILVAAACRMIDTFVIIGYNMINFHVVISGKLLNLEITSLASHPLAYVIQIR